MTVIKQFFPELDAKWLEPLDNQVFIQLKYTQVSKIFKLPQSEKRAEQLASSVGKVIAKGCAAYKKKDGSGEVWPDYNVEVGDYVIVCKGIATNYIWLKHPENKDDEVLLISMPDSGIKQRILNPLKAIESLADIKLGA